MKIINGPAPGPIIFRDVAAGDVFHIKGSGIFYLKLAAILQYRGDPVYPEPKCLPGVNPTPAKPMNAVDIESGALYCIPSEELCTPVHLICTTEI